MVWYNCKGKALAPLIIWGFEISGEMVNMRTMKLDGCTKLHWGPIGK